MWSLCIHLDCRFVEYASHLVGVDCRTFNRVVGVAGLFLPSWKRKDIGFSKIRHMDAISYLVLLNTSDNPWAGMYVVLYVLICAKIPVDSIPPAHGFSLACRITAILWWKEELPADNPFLWSATPLSELHPLFYRYVLPIQSAKTAVVNLILDSDLRGR